MRSRPSRPSRLLQRVALGLAVLVAVPLLACLLFAATALFALRAAPGDWSVPVALGPVGMRLGVPALIRVATHPLGIRALAGRSIATRQGRITFATGATAATLVVHCAPCSIAVPLLAAQPIRIADVVVTVEHGMSNRFRGVLRAGDVQASWRADLQPAGVGMDVDLADTPVASLVALFGAAVPEATQARIAGVAGGRLHLEVPSLRYTIEPRLNGIAVDGLGTDALLAGSPAPACGRTPRAHAATAPFGAWLPRAVVAAEDQRFAEHAGYDVAEMAAAWSSDGVTRRRGASTLSQQLAKLLYTGDAPTVARKVRELLYAVELDRTLGKARVLEIYLDIAPWGDGQCGGEAAALHYFGRHAASLGPRESIWLASLLRNPQMELDKIRQGDGSADAARLATIAEALRPLPRWRRDEIAGDLAHWVPPPVALLARHGPSSDPEVASPLAMAPARD